MLNATQVGNAMSVFAGNLFSTIAGQQRPGESGNFLLSPDNLHHVIGMCAAGALGETRAELYRALGFGETTMEALEFAKAARHLRKEYARTGTRLTLHDAFGAYVVEGNARLKRPYKDFIEGQYDAVVDTVVPGDETRINEFVARKTEGKIPQLVPAGTLDDLSGLLLIGATYLKADWARRLGEPMSRYFTPFGGKKETILAMTDEGMYKFMRANGFSMAALPFIGGAFSMVFFLPDGEPASATDFAGRIAREGGWGEMVSKLLKRGKQKVEVMIPRFETRARFDDMKPALEALGVNLPFDALRADFTPMANAGAGRNLYVKRVIHEATIGVTEKGVEAAAGTAVDMSTLGVEIKPPVVEFILDKPFAWAIVGPMGALLFMGWENFPNTPEEKYELSNSRHIPTGYE